MDKQAPRETERERHRNNIVLLLVFVAVVGAGVWLVNALIDAANIDNCISQRLPNCGKIEP